MDEPDRVEERDTLLDGVMLHFNRETYTTVSFKKTQDFKVESWYLTNTKEATGYDPLQPHKDMEVGGIRALTLEDGRKLWNDLLSDGWRRSTEDEIKEVEKQPEYTYSDGSVWVDADNSAIVPNLYEKT